MAPDIPTISKLGDLFGNIISSLLALGGIICFIMFVMGGIKFLTSGGDPKAVEGAKKTLTSAIFGVVLLAASYLILVLIEKFTGAPVTIFNITRP